MCIFKYCGKCFLWRWALIGLENTWKPNDDDDKDAMVYWTQVKGVLYSQPVYSKSINCGGLVMTKKWHVSLILLVVKQFSNWREKSKDLGEKINWIWCSRNMSFLSLHPVWCAGSHYLCVSRCVCGWTCRCAEDSCARVLHLISLLAVLVRMAR